MLRGSVSFFEVPGLVPVQMQLVGIVFICLSLLWCFFGLPSRTNGPIRSYSWSANVCGRKEWLLYPPGEEDSLRDALGNLPLDVNELDPGKRASKPIRIVQGPGEVIFVPR